MIELEYVFYYRNHPTIDSIVYRNKCVVKNGQGRLSMPTVFNWYNREEMCGRIDCNMTLGIL